MRVAHNLIKIFPEIAFQAQCPIDEGDLFIKKVIIPGMRCLADAICPICKTHFYVDLPVGHALASPITLNQATAEIYDHHNISWFSQPLKEGFLNPVKEELVPIVHKFFDTDRIVIINCLDFLYGHVLLKLLNVQQYLDHTPELGCCVIVPSQLVHLVPEGVAEIWECPITLKAGWKWYKSLEQWFSRQITGRKECFLSPVYSHPNNRMYDLRRFVKDLPDISDRIQRYAPIILFSYREDRLWGRTFSQQKHNIQTLYKLLHSIFPNLAFVLIGFGKRKLFRTMDTNIIDLRIEQFNREQDRLWLAYMQVSDCALGVHGSNMLLPSGLAKSTVELVPTSRLGNTVQDFLFPYGHYDNRDALLFYRMVYGNETLANISPTTLTPIIVSTIADAPRNSLWFKVEEPENLQKMYSILKSTVVQEANKFFQTTKQRFFITQRIKSLLRKMIKDH